LAWRIAWTAEITRPRCSASVQSTVISRTDPPPSPSTASTALITPPAREIADVTRLSAPPLRGSSTRSVSENWALGVDMP
jgi:hypothetical protein